MVSSAPAMQRSAPSDDADAILSDSEEFGGATMEGNAAAPALLPDPITWVATTSPDADVGLTPAHEELSGQDNPAALTMAQQLYDVASP